jgi:hypothetical protein
LFGSVVNGRWTATPGPRLAAGTGPTGVALLPSGDLAVTDGQSAQVRVLHALGNGFFDDAPPPSQVLTVATGPIDNVIVPDAAVFLPNGAVLQPGVSALARTAEGGIIGIDLETGATQTVFAPPAGQAVEAFTLVLPAEGGAPLLVTANADGTVSLLADAAGAGFTEERTIAATAGTPSALEILETAPGLFDVYLTEQGDSTPVVLTLDLRAELNHVEGPAGQEVTAGLSVVAVLTTEVTAATTTATFVGQGPAPETFNPFALALTQAVEAGLLAPDEATELAADEQVAALGQALVSLIVGPGVGGDDEEAPEAAGSAGGAAERPTLEQFLSGFMEALESLRRDDRPGSDGNADLMEGVRLWLQGWIESWQQRAPADEAPDAQAPPAPEQAAPEEAGVAQVLVAASVTPAAEEAGPVLEMAAAPPSAPPQAGLTDLVFAAAALVGGAVAPEGPRAGRARAGRGAVSRG